MSAYLVSQFPFLVSKPKRLLTSDNWKHAHLFEYNLTLLTFYYIYILGRHLKPLLQLDVAISNLINFRSPYRNKQDAMRATETIMLVSTNLKRELHAMPVFP